MAELILFTTRNFLFMKQRNRIFAIDLSFRRLINRKQTIKKKTEQAQGFLMANQQTQGFLMINQQTTRLF
jgi:hypothetical protein